MLPDLPAPVLRALFGCETEVDWCSEHGWTIWELRYGEAEYCPQWRNHKAELLQVWVADHPGTRPPIWWRLDAPEPRQDQESEAAYLRRHKLFMRGEERRLTNIPILYQTFRPPTVPPAA
jgi:hypothetical protein